MDREARARTNDWIDPRSFSLRGMMYGSARRTVPPMVAVALLWVTACGDAGPDVAGPPPVVNRPPTTIGTIPAQMVSAGETAAIDVSAYFRDPDGDALSYAAASSNAGVAGVAVTGTSVAVTALAKGGATVTVEARDPQGLIAQQRFQVTVPNRIPEAVEAIPVQTLFAGETASLDASAYFRDPDGDPLTYLAASANANIATATAARAAITIRAVAPGVTTVSVSVEDPDGGTAGQVVHVTVPNRGPVAVGSMPAHTVSVGETVTVDVSSYFSDPDGDGLSYAAASSNAGIAGVSVSGGSVAVTALAKGVATITVEARDPQGLIAQQRFQVAVPNRAPEAVDAIPAQTVFTGETASVDASAYFRDPDGDPLTYSATSSAAGVVSASISGSTLTLRGVAAGTAMVTATARDADGGTVEQVVQVTVPNRAPEAVGTIPNQTVATGQTATLDVSSYFRDPDGDRLTYTAASNTPAVATAAASGSRVTITAVAAGAATVTVTARDPDGLAATSSFGVTVETPAAGSFQIELVFATSVTTVQEAAFRRAAERWMRILAPTELPDWRGNRPLTCGSDPRFERYVETIDDLMIVVAVGEIDGPRGTLGQAGPCWIRLDPTARYLPFYGRMEFDVADLELLEQSGDLEDVILHEMGHVLGIGTIWDRLGLLRNPASETETPDTHFTGRLAIAAFDEAGGTAYKGAKVPVENTGGAGTWNSHWRRDVFGMELMIGWADGTATPSPVSAITVQSLADLGYAVDLAAADPYGLPSADAVRAMKTARQIPYGNDIWRGPIVVVDADGRIVRVIPG